MAAVTLSLVHPESGFNLPLTIIPQTVIKSDQLRVSLPETNNSRVSFAQDFFFQISGGKFLNFSYPGFIL